MHNCAEDNTVGVSGINKDIRCSPLNVFTARFLPHNFPLQVIFDSCLREDYMPSMWKAADVIPLPTTRPPMSVEKHIHPISLNPVAAKVFVSLIVRRMKPFISAKTDPCQFEVMPGTCITDALVKMLQSWYEASDTPGSVIQIVLLDYSKAFDHINHNALLRKLTVSIPPHFVRWMGAFLLDRVQRVKIDDHYSSHVQPNGGVKHDTVTGPVNFFKHKLIKWEISPGSVFEAKEFSTRYVTVVH